MNIPQNWHTNLSDEDMNFIKRFVLSSGSLKEIANQYELSYPTVRLRLDKLIQKIKENDIITLNDPFITHIKQLALNEIISLDVAKSLIDEYKKIKKAKYIVVYSKYSRTRRRHRRIISRAFRSNLWNPHGCF